MIPRFDDGRDMKQRTAVLCVFAFGAFGAAWWLFGFTTTEHTAGGTLRAHRYFGRVVRVDLDRDADRVIDHSFRYSWRVPLRPHQPPQTVLSDYDSDGRWDLWVVPVGHDGAGYPLARFRVDTDGDARPDWSFVDHWQSDDAYAKIKAGRGF